MATVRERAVRGSPAVRLAVLGGVIGPIVFAIVVVVAGFAYDGYSHVSQKISELGGEGAEYAILQNLNFVVIGVLILGFSWALARAIAPSYLGPALVGYFGLVFLAHAWIPCDLGCQGKTTIMQIIMMIAGTGCSACIRWTYGHRFDATRFGFGRVTQ